MSSPQSGSAANAARMNESMAKAGYDIGIPATQQRNALLTKGLAEGGMPDYMKAAFDVQRTGLQEGGANVAQQQRAQMLTAAEPAIAGGNQQQALSAGALGSKLADALYGSRVQQGLGGIDQMNKLMTMGLGGSAATGSQAIGAAGNDLRAIGMMQNYNPTYAAVLGGANLVGAGYGAYKQAGAAGGGGGAGMPTSDDWYSYMSGQGAGGMPTSTDWSTLLRGK